MAHTNTTPIIEVPNWEGSEKQAQLWQKVARLASKGHIVYVERVYRMEHDGDRPGAARAYIRAKVIVDGEIQRWYSDEWGEEGFRKA